MKISRMKMLKLTVPHGWMFPSQLASKTQLLLDAYARFAAPPTMHWAICGLPGDITCVFPGKKRK
jgi:hypothetical protein